MASIARRFFRWLLPPPDPRRVKPALTISADPPPDKIVIAGGPALPFSRHITLSNGKPIVDWTAVRDWINALPESVQSNAWTACERAWLVHFRAALGPQYRLAESDTALLVSSLDPSLAAATLDFMNRTPREIVAILRGLAEVPEWGKDLLIVFDDDESYYEYVSHYYPEEREIAASGGMHIDSGCSHFVTVKQELRLVEPVIAHEMTHGCVSHLPLPLWLNEGLAVNTEQRLTGVPRGQYAPDESHAKHLAYWTRTTIQEFWSGDSFHRVDEGRSLAYELARIIVAQLAPDWDRFRAFALVADRADGGAAAARAQLGADLGEIAAALLEQASFDGWSPDPATWDKPGMSDRA